MSIVAIFQEIQIISKTFNVYLCLYLFSFFFGMGLYYLLVIIGHLF